MKSTPQKPSETILCMYKIVSSTLSPTTSPPTPQLEKLSSKPLEIH